MIDNTDVRPLLEKLCADLGFCLPPSESEKLSANPPETALEFTNAVFLAEGLAPEVADRQLFRQVRECVSQAFRCSEEHQELLTHSHPLTPNNYPVVWTFKNDTALDMTLYLELIPEEVILSPGDEVELLARPNKDLLPLDVERVAGGFQVHAYKVADPDWHVRFMGKVIKACTPTRLIDHR